MMFGMNGLRILIFLLAVNTSMSFLGPVATLASPSSQPAIPPDNPMSPEKIELGRLLYFDPRLSITGKVSCNSCHNVLGSGTDNLSASVGVYGKKGNRRAPTVWNAAFQSVQFWDGRAPSLEEQAKGPMVNPVEMGMPNHQAITDRLSKIPGYQKMFKTVYGNDQSITIENVAKAIAAFERTLVAQNSDYDRFLAGDKKALSQSAQRGLQLVQKVGCTTCHMGTHFSGPSLPVGQGFYMKFPTFPGSEYEKKYRLTEDLGRYAVTQRDQDKNFWRVPTWRNVELTGPYFHNGSVKSLDEAVRVMAKVQLNKDLKKKEVDDIVAFLKSLTGKRPEIANPELPEGKID